jgi:hypothetical protein
MSKGNLTRIETKAGAFEKVDGVYVPVPAPAKRLTIRQRLKNFLSTLTTRRKT